MKFVHVFCVFYGPVVLFYNKTFTTDTLILSEEENNYTRNVTFGRPLEIQKDISTIHNILPVGFKNIARKKKKQGFYYIQITSLILLRLLLFLSKSIVRLYWW